MRMLPSAADALARALARVAELEAELKCSRAEVERLSKAARAVCFSPTAGETIVYVKASALRDLDELIRDERKEGK